MLYCCSKNIPGSGKSLALTLLSRRRQIKLVHDRKSVYQARGANKNIYSVHLKYTGYSAVRATWVCALPVCINIRRANTLECHGAALENTTPGVFVVSLIDENVRSIMLTSL